MSSFEPSVAWNRIAKSWSAVFTVAEMEPEEIVVVFSAVTMFDSLFSGFPCGYRSKCGPGLRAPSQCVTSTEMAPSKGAPISWEERG